MRSKHCLWIAIALPLVIVSVPAAQAATVSTGALTLNLDSNALREGVQLDNYPDTPTANFPICCRPSIYLEEFWDASAANKTFVQIRDDNTPDLFDAVSDEISANGLRFQVNGPVIPANPLLRQNRASTFSFDPSNLTGTATGAIGLGGVLRFRLDVNPPTNRMLVGDMTLEYHPVLEGSTPGRSGWLLVNHIGFDADAFELFDVTSSQVGSDFTLSGNVGFGWGFDHVGATQARLEERRIGSFTFSSSEVPLPPSLTMLLSGLGGLGVLTRRRQTHS